jgi:hypothetical protein
MERMVGCGTGFLERAFVQARKRCLKDYLVYRPIPKILALRET